MSSPILHSIQFYLSFKAIKALWSKLLQGSSALAWTGLSMLGASLVCLVLAMVDPRLFQGVSVWHKPWKFQLSTVMYLWSLALFLSFFSASKRFVKPSVAHHYIVWVSISASLFEVLYITWQGALGQASHYNTSSYFYAHMYTAMGVVAVLLTSTAGVLGYRVLRDKAGLYATSLAMRHAIGWGLTITCVLGSVTGGVLGARTRSGGHWVGGTANDALGLAVFNWSRDGGDLRVAHFFALHAMQFLPALALALLWASPATEPASAKRLVWLVAIGFSVFCVWTLMQALRGLPFLG